MFSGKAAVLCLQSLFNQYWEEYLELKPLWATFYGDPRYNGQMRNMFSAEHREQMRILHGEYLDRARRINRNALSRQDALSYDIFIRDQELALESMQFPDWLIPINQYSVYTYLARWGSGAGSQPFKSIKDYENWISRIARINVITDTAITNMREGISRGYSQPKSVVKKVVGQFDTLISEDVEKSIYWGAIAIMPDEISDPERTRLTRLYRTLLADTVMPAHVKLRDYLRDEYLPNCRDSYGYQALPDGKQWYAHLVKVQTTTRLAPEEIHEIGILEVARILDEMHEVMTAVHFEGELQDFFRYLQAEDRLYFQSEEELIAGYEALRGKVRAVLSAYFDIFPKTELEIRPVEAFRAKSAAGASYTAGTPDGSRPGIFYVNTHNLKAQPKYGMETLYLHEAEPGHHFAISVQHEIKDLPMFRRLASETAYNEGWALYAESIEREMGLFTDPYQYFGKLNDEQLRAMRLVVDTGLHYYGWTRQQAIEYMQQNSAMAESDIQSEVDRYMANPAQALAYKIGQRAIWDMRNRAEYALGDSFDIRAFHRQILIDGSLPMDVLGKKIDSWIVEQQSECCTEDTTEKS